MNLHVMSFNIRGTVGSRLDGINAWENRRTLNIATILKYAPDIMGFQEAKQGNFDAYDEALRAYSSFRGLGASRNDGSEHTPIYWKTNRFELVETGQFYLSASPGKESVAWDSSLVRVAAWVKLRDIASDTIFFVLNTHFPHEDEANEARNHCAKLVIERVKAHAGDLPIIVMGDFNATPDSDAYRSFIGDGFTDTYEGSPSDRPHTYHGYEGETYSVGERAIDWILTKRFSTVDYQIITDAEVPLYPSDHYPVLVNLAAEAEGE